MWVLLLELCSQAPVRIKGANEGKKRLLVGSSARVGIGIGIRIRCSLVSALTVHSSDCGSFIGIRPMPTRQAPANDKQSTSPRLR
jgi:hypothetical protein